MLSRESFIQDWRARMGAEVPLTEESVLVYLNKREDAAPSQGQQPARWFNGCDKTVPAALRFLANNPRPTGPRDYNAEHLYQLADEIDGMAKQPLPAAPAPAPAPAGGGTKQEWAAVAAGLADVVHTMLNTMWTANTKEQQKALIRTGQAAIGAFRALERSSDGVAGSLTSGGTWFSKWRSAIASLPGGKDVPVDATLRVELERLYVQANGGHALGGEDHMRRTLEELAESLLALMSRTSQPQAAVNAGCCGNPDDFPNDYSDCRHKGQPPVTEVGLWRVGQFWSSSRAGRMVLCLSEGAKEIAEHTAHASFVRWIAGSDLPVKGALASPTHTSTEPVADDWKDTCLKVLEVIGYTTTEAEISEREFPGEKVSQAVVRYLERLAASRAPSGAMQMPRLTDAMRAVLRNEHDIHGSEDALYLALADAAHTCIVEERPLTVTDVLCNQGAFFAHCQSFAQAMGYSGVGQALNDLQARRVAPPPAWAAWVDDWMGRSDIVMRTEAYQELLAALAAQQLTIPAGWKAMPPTATKEMLDAYMEDAAEEDPDFRQTLRDQAADDYATMWKAQPAALVTRATTMGERKTRWLLENGAETIGVALRKDDRIGVVTPEGRVDWLVPSERGGAAPATECQTVFGEECRLVKDGASGKVQCQFCGREKATHQLVALPLGWRGKLLHLAVWLEANGHAQPAADVREFLAGSNLILENQHG